jgi:hypothetical protein
MLLDLFSKRKKRERGEITDVYTYSDVPEALRVQIIHIIRDGLETSGNTDPKTYESYKFLHDSLAREYGKFVLAETAKYENYDRALFEFFLATKDIERVLDIVELAFRYLMIVVPTWRYETLRRVSPEDAVDELNARFRESGVGYQFEGGEIVRVDSELLHQEAFKPALHLLHKPGFEGANEEFLKAHEHYRHGQNKEALNEALKAFESTMKAICTRRGWQYEISSPASKLIEVCFSNALLPTSLQTYFTGVRTTLEAGIPTVRNKMSGHGQGPEPIQVPQYIVAYALNITASAIRLLAEADGT